MSDTTTTSRTAASDSLRVRTFDVSAVRDRIENWDQLSKRDRKRLLESGAIVPESDRTHANTTTRTLHNAIAGAMLGNAIDPITHLVLGSSWGGGTEPSDSAFTVNDISLNSFVAAFDATAAADAALDGNTWVFDLLLGSLEFQNTTFREWGLRRPTNNDLYNHGPIDPAIEKGDQEAVLLTATLRFGDVAEASTL